MINLAQVAAMTLRQYGNTLSNEHCKKIHELVDPKELAAAIRGLDGPYNIREVEALAKVAGDMDTDHSFERDGDLWRDDILDKYADYIHNYQYTYNDEALKVDPFIDTEKEHIGPMAQDIQKVNEACVNKDPESGYLTVDDGRVALMNMGAIADLAREVREIKKVVNA